MSACVLNFLINFIICGCTESSLLHVGLSLVAASGGYSVVVVCGLLTTVASFVAECRLQVHGLQSLQLAGSVIEAHVL